MEFHVALLAGCRDDAILGVPALIGIIIRNTVILVTQIDAFLADGLAPWNAVIEATLAGGPGGERDRLRAVPVAWYRIGES